MMHIRIGSTLAIATAMALSGCGGGSGTEPLPHAPIATQGAGALKITIKVPKLPKTQRRGVRPNYISPSTKSLTVAIDSGTPVAYGLTPTSSGCVAANGSTPLTCTIRLSLAAGTHTGTFKTYDGANGTGNVLSAHAGVSLTIQPGQANTLGLVLNGEIASIALSLANPAPQQGTAATIALNVNAYDADNNLIIGPGSYDYLPITLSDSDTSGATALSTTTVSAPSTNVTVTYNGNAIPSGSATFSASEGTIVTSASQEAVLTPFSLGTWTTVAPMPTARDGLAAGVINGVLYAVGGFGSNTPRVPASNLGTLEAFNPDTNTWTTQTPMPTSRSQLGAAVINGILYAVGGYPSQLGLFNNKLEAYDPSTNAWTEKAPMPTPRGNLAVGTVGGVLYVVGGEDDNSSAVSTLEAYDPVANAWSTKAPMPTPRQGLTAAVVDGLLYAVGGYNANGVLSNVEAYDPSTNTWTKKASMPSPLQGSASGVLNGMLYVFGGVNSSYTDTTEAYNPSTNSWAVKTQMPIPNGIYSEAAAALNGRLYAIGGFTPSANGYLNTVEAFTP